MSANLDDFERELMQYSELGPIPEKLAPPPLTIQKYQKMIRENNAAGIFDADYSCPETTTSKDINTDEKEYNPEEILYRNEHHVTRITSGRGRGGRNIFHPPGHQVGLSEDDLELIRDIRKVAPLGYANEITENAIRAHQRAKRLEREMDDNKKTETKRVTSLKSKAISPGTTQTGVKSETDLAAVASATSPSRKEIDDFEDFIKQETPSPSTSNPEANGQQVIEKASESVAISTLLKQCRERHKQKQQRLIREKLENEARTGKTEGALCNNATAKGQKTPKKSPRRTDNYSNKLPSTAQNSTENEKLPWRIRSDSPSRFPWRDVNSHKRLSLKSLQDFPPLS